MIVRKIKLKLKRFLYFTCGDAVKGLWCQIVDLLVQL